MKKTNTQQLSEFIADLKYEDIPKEVIEQVKRLTLHTIGVSVASASIKQAHNAIKLAEDNGGVEEATVWGGSGKKIPAESAAFANGTQADFLDWEDCSWTGHPSAGAIPTAFAVSEAKNKTGKDYILAVVAAYEGYQRIAMAVQPSKEYLKTHFWGLNSWQTYAATFAATKLYGFDAEKTNQAIGATLYATPVATNLHSNGKSNSDIYHYAHGTAAYAGLFATKITELGFDNGKDYLDGNKGYWSMVSDKNDEEWYTKDLGKRWLILDTYIKHWPANMWIQTPLEILDGIYKEHPFTAEEVKSVKLSPITTLTANDYTKTARKTLDAQFNAPFCLAAYILNPNPGGHWFTEDQLERKEVLELASKITEHGEVVTPNDNFDKFKQGDFPTMTIDVELKDGTVLTKTAAYPKGHPKNNTSLEEEYALFKNITAQYIGEKQADTFIEGIKNLENLENLNELARNLVRNN